MSNSNMSGRDTLRALGPQHRALRKHIPGVYEGFVGMSQAAYKDGALDKRTKELIALAIGVVEGCDGCISSHGQSAVRAGATAEEAAEAIGVAIAMHGGPATIYGARAFAVIEEFLEALEAGESPA